MALTRKRTSCSRHRKHSQSLYILASIYSPGQSTGPDAVQACSHKVLAATTMPDPIPGFSSPSAGLHVLVHTDPEQRAARLPAEPVILAPETNKTVYKRPSLGGGSARMIAAITTSTTTTTTTTRYFQSRQVPGHSAMLQLKVPPCTRQIWRVRGSHMGDSLRYLGHASFLGIKKSPSHLSSPMISKLRTASTILGYSLTVSNHERHKVLLRHGQLLL